MAISTSTGAATGPDKGFPSAVTKERGLPYPIGSDTVRSTHAMSEQAMRILDSHTHSDNEGHLHNEGLRVRIFFDEYNEFMRTMVVSIRPIDFKRAKTPKKADAFTPVNDDAARDINPAVHQMVTDVATLNADMAFAQNIFPDDNDKDGAMQIIRVSDNVKKG